jgi:hypothetical protein
MFSARLAKAMRPSVADEGLTEVRHGLVDSSDFSALGRDKQLVCNRGF